MIQLYPLPPPPGYTVVYPLHHSPPPVQWAKPEELQRQSSSAGAVAQAHCRHLSPAAESCHQFHTWAPVLAPSGMDSDHQLHPPEQGEPLENIVSKEV